jgi:hypothetical protein
VNSDGLYCKGKGYMYDNMRYECFCTAVVFSKAFNGIELFANLALMSYSINLNV